MQECHTSKSQDKLETFSSPWRKKAYDRRREKVINLSIFFACLSTIKPHQMSGLFLIYTLLCQHPRETSQTFQLFGFIGMRDRHQTIMKDGE